MMDGMIILGALLRITMLLVAVWLLIPDAPAWRIGTVEFILHMVTGFAIYWPKGAP